MFEEARLEVHENFKHFSLVRQHVSIFTVEFHVDDLLRFGFLDAYNTR